jgi:hypothetical protein
MMRALVLESIASCLRYIDRARSSNQQLPEIQSHGGHKTAYIVLDTSNNKLMHVLRDGSASIAILDRLAALHAKMNVTS